MDLLAKSSTFVLEGFRLDQDGLFRRDQNGVFVPIAMGVRALDVLRVLVGRAGSLVSRDQMIAAVWPATVVGDNNLNVQIGALRRVLDEGRADGSCIETVPGRGYRFTVPVMSVESSVSTACGRQSGKGASGPINEQPERPDPPAPRPCDNTPPKVPPRARRRFWAGGLVLVAGGLCLLGIMVTSLNLRSPRFGAVSPAPRLSIVVLPFIDLSDDRDQRQLADSITDELTTNLSLLPDVRVTSQKTAFTYGSKFVDTKQVGRELGVHYLLEGSVQRSGSQVRVNAQLIDSETDANVWAQRFDSEVGNLFVLKDDITGRIVNALNVEMVNGAAGRLTEHSDPLDYILRGRAATNQPSSPAGFAEQARLFERALSLDPGSVDAMTLLATVHAQRTLEAMTDSPTTDIARAEELIGKALAASPLNPRAHFARGMVLRTQGKFEEATFEFEAVLAHNPNSVAALFQLGVSKMWAGSIDEVIPATEKLIYLSPRDPYIANKYMQIGFVHLLQSRTDQAILWLEKARSANPELRYVHASLAAIYALKGDTERAAAELGEARRLADDGRFSTMARLSRRYWGVPRIRALAEATLFAGLRKAGVPEE
jgi:TolB-like protein/DNA-binding winged helix-turn-helix (wHTH) protein/Flp pilus assembly protein TadD